MNASAPHADLGAVILAGGLARRMGGIDKALVPLDGRPMIAYALRAIAPRVQRVVVNANRNAAAYAALVTEIGAEVVADAHAGHPGPLAGLSAGIAALGTGRVFMCPCDSPFVTAALLDTLVDGLEAAPAGTRVACAHDGGRLQPVFAVVRAEARAPLDAFLAADGRKIDRWYAEVGFQPVDCSAHVGAFRNINTEDERIAAERDLAGVA